MHKYIFKIKVKFRSRPGVCFPRRHHRSDETAVHLIWLSAVRLVVSFLSAIKKNDSVCNLSGRTRTCTGACEPEEVQAGVVSFCFIIYVYINTCLLLYSDIYKYYKWVPARISAPRLTARSSRPAGRLGPGAPRRAAARRVALPARWPAAVPHSGSHRSISAK